MNWRITRRSLPGALWLGVSACRKSPSRIVLIPKTTGTYFWERLRSGVTRTASRRGLKVITHAPESESDYSAQALMLEDAIQTKPDGIILAPSHGSVLASGIRHARAKGIPLVLVESSAMVNPDEYLGFVGNDETALGAMAASRIGMILGGRGDIAVLGVSPTIETTTLRERAFARTIAERFPRMRIADVRYGLGEHLRSAEVAKDILEANPNLQGFFASDSMGTRGAYAALRHRPGAGVRLVGVALDVDLRKRVAEGMIDSLVIQRAYMMGKLAAEMLLRHWDHAASQTSRVETGIALATRENVESARISLLADGGEGGAGGS